MNEFVNYLSKAQLLIKIRIFSLHLNIVVLIWRHKQKAILLCLSAKCSENETRESFVKALSFFRGVEKHHVKKSKSKVTKRRR
jgi:hypothetical protein